MQGRALQFADNLSWVKGQHTLKFGGDFQVVTLHANSTLQARPSFSFNGVYTQNPQARLGTGAAFADFLLGYTNSATVSTRSISESRQKIVQGYVQDDWVATPRLTLNLGLRYELALPFYETRDQYSDLILDPGPLYGTLLDASQASAHGYLRSFVDPDWNNFAPRVGFAYKATQNTVIRGAFGVFYGRDENIPVARRPTNNPPYFIQKTYTSDQITPNIVLQNGFPPDALAPSNIVNPDVNSYLKNTPLPLRAAVELQCSTAGGQRIRRRGGICRLGRTEAVRAAESQSASSGTGRNQSAAPDSGLQRDLRTRALGQLKLPGIARATGAALLERALIARRVHVRPLDRQRRRKRRFRRRAPKSAQSHGESREL